MSINKQITNHLLISRQQTIASNQHFQSQRETKEGEKRKRERNKEGEKVEKQREKEKSRIQYE